MSNTVQGMASYKTTQGVPGERARVRLDEHPRLRGHADH